MIVLVSASQLRVDAYLSFSNRWRSHCLDTLGSGVVFVGVTTLGAGAIGWCGGCTHGAGAIG